MGGGQGRPPGELPNEVGAKEGGVDVLSPTARRYTERARFLKKKLAATTQGLTFLTWSFSAGIPKTLASCNTWVQIPR